MLRGAVVAWCTAAATAAITTTAAATESIAHAAENAGGAVAACRGRRLSSSRGRRCRVVVQRRLATSPCAPAFSSRVSRHDSLATNGTGVVFTQPGMNAVGVEPM